MITKLKATLRVRPVWLLVALTLVTLALGYLAGLLTPIPPAARVPVIDVNDGMLLAVLAAMGLFVGHLYTRLGKLEERITAMEAAKAAALDKLAAAASFINRIGLWLMAGQRGTLPQPPDQILAHIDAELWEPPIGGTDD